MSVTDVYANGFDEENGKTISTTDCPECAGRLLTEGGEISCTECGLIVNEYWIDHGPERTIDDDSKRTGAPLTVARHDRGLSTEIGFGRDARGNALSGGKRRQIGRLRVQHHRSRWRGKAERNLGHAFGEISRMVGALELPKVVREEACLVYRRAQSENLIVGRSIEAMAAGSVYAACRCGGYVRTIEEVAEVARCDRGKVRLGYQVLTVELGLEAVPVGPSDLVPRLASKLVVPATVKHRALEYALLAEEIGIANGRKPSGVAAASLYAAGKEAGVSVTQSELKRAAEVAPVTIRERYQELLAEKDSA